MRNKPRKSILTLFGTRPEVIKLAPVLLQLERRSDSVRAINVASGQHAHLVSPFVDLFGLRVDYDLRVMADNQTLQELLRRVISGVSSVIARENPDLILVQGDTTTALAGAIAGQQWGVPVAHVEAGLRSGNLRSPYPEEINRIGIAQLATFHFAATESNRDSLLREGIRENAIFVTGNPIVDALQAVLREKGQAACSDLLAGMESRKCIVLTAHRRESFGALLEQNLRVLRDFVQRHEDVFLVFPVHPNPNVSAPAGKIFEDSSRAILIPPLPYPDFIRLVCHSWLIVSDSGGIQEEVPSLGKPLLILRDNTERPECIEAGFARLVGRHPDRLRAMLEEAYREDSWVNSVHQAANPFGKGDAAKRIVHLLLSLLERQPMESFAMGQPPLGKRDSRHAFLEQS